jgi:Glycosyl hydrolases family 39
MNSINFFCDLAEPTTPFPHFWEHTVGSDHAPVAVRVHIQRIDGEHVNPKRLWMELGQPEYLDRQQVEQLEKASRLVREKQSVSYDDSVLHLETNLPPHAVASITIEVEHEESNASR